MIDDAARSQPEPTIGGGRLGRDAISAIGLAAVPVLFTIVAVVSIVSAQGGYFPTSWGWSVLALLTVFAVWAIAGGETDAGRRDAAFVVALALLTTWVGLSITWSIDRPQTVLELERGLVLLAGCIAFLLLARRAALRLLVVALVVAIGAIAVYALGTRLAPERLGSFDPTAGYRLSDPVGYWNALGMFSALGILLALGLASEAGAGLVGRAIGAAALVVLPLTLYFTFSRGAWIGLAFGLASTIATSPRRLLLVVEGASLAAVPILAIFIASRSKGLTEQYSALVEASREGRRLAAIVAGLAIVQVAVLLVIARLEPTFRPPAFVRRGFAAVLIVVALAAGARAVAHLGGPLSFPRQAYDSFVEATPPTEGADLNDRLFSVNGNGRAQLWRVAIEADRGHWLAGTGAGSFERNWDRSPRASFVVRDAHSLYLETLSELGIVGLALLVTLLAVPLAAATRVRAVPLVPAAVGAYATFLLHNAVDWDWELSGIALTGLFAGCLLLVASRGHVRRVAPWIRSAGLVAAAAAGAFALVAAVGNGALAHAKSANEQRRYDAAASQARLARRWMPWSPDPWLALGEAQLGSNDPPAAAASFRRATSIDPADWEAWLDLAAAAQGRTRLAAIARAHSLYPNSGEIRQFLDELRGG